MASPSLILRFAADEMIHTLGGSSSSSCYDAFVPVFRPDPSAASPGPSSVDRVQSQFLSVEPDLFHDALVSPRPDHLGFSEEEDEGEEASLRWDSFQLDDDGDGEPDLPLQASTSADEFDWEEVASASGAGVEPPEPDWEVLAHVPPPATSDAGEGFLYTSDREAYEVLVGDGDGFFLKPPAARSAVEALPSSVVTAGDGGEDCAVCRDGVAAGERVKMLPCSHRYHQDCILPWLEVCNSCPLCRFELPTDDPNYENWKARRATAA